MVQHEAFLYAEQANTDVKKGMTIPQIRNGAIKVPNTVRAVESNRKTKTLASVVVSFLLCHHKHP